MAALDRRISILEFVGQSWTFWIDKACASTPEGSSLEECSKNAKKSMETMTLKKEDMSIYGQCPAHDDFFLVVCSHCDQVVKPQAFERHCERRHDPFSKLHGSSSNCSPDRPQQGKPASQHNSISEGLDRRHQNSGPPPHSPHRGCSKPQREGHSLLRVDKISHGTPPSPPHFSIRGSSDLHHRGPTPPKVPPPAEKPFQKSLDSPTTLHHGLRTYSRTYKNIPKKDCDLDRHCGVMDPERKKLCTRLLTCNIHSVHQRRQVVGRSKAFDLLVTELKMNSKPRERPPLPKVVPDGGSAQLETPWSQCTPLHSTCQIANSSVLRSMTPSDSVVEVEQKGMLSEEMQVESLSASFSSEESDDENREEFAHLPINTCHPKPLGFCTFGAHVLGRSMLAFDRRLLHLRSAFTVMMEQHLSTYLWKKIPQVSELCSYQPHGTTNTFNSYNTTFISRPSHKASSLRTSTSGKSELQSTNLTTPSSLPTKTQSVSGPGQHHNLVRRSRKQTLQATFCELQESPTSIKRRKSPLEEEELPGQGKLTYTPHHRGKESSLARTAISIQHGPFNGTPSSKQRPSAYTAEIKGQTHMPAHMTSSPSESDKGGASGPNHRTLGYEHKGRKRKTIGASPPKNTSCATKSSILFSLSQTHSSLASWGEDGRPGSNPHTVSKRLGAQKPKLLH